MLKFLGEKVDNMQEQMSIVNRDMEILRKKQKEMPESKNTVTEMKQMLLMTSLVYKAEERISEFEDRSLGTSQTEIQKKKEREKEQNRASKNCRKFQGLQHTQNRTLEEDREKGAEEKFKVKMTGHF